MFAGKCDFSELVYLYFVSRSKYLIAVNTCVIMFALYISFFSKKGCFRQKRFHLKSFLVINNTLRHSE
jgi:hypothetical protein